MLERLPLQKLETKGWFYSIITKERQNTKENSNILNSNGLILFLRIHIYVRLLANYTQRRLDHFLVKVLHVFHLQPETEKGDKYNSQFGLAVNFERVTYMCF